MNFVETILSPEYRLEFTVGCVFLIALVGYLYVRLLLRKPKPKVARARSRIVLFDSRGPSIDLMYEVYRDTISISNNRVEATLLSGFPLSVFFGSGFSVVSEDLPEPTVRESSVGSVAIAVLRHNLGGELGRWVIQAKGTDTDVDGDFYGNLSDERFLRVHLGSDHMLSVI